MDVKIKLIDGGKLPQFQHVGDACADCYARIDYDVTIPAHQRECIPLGFALELPDGYEAVIRPRSGESKRKHDTCIGTIDSNYRGEVMATICNNNIVPFVITDGMRICQMAIRKTEKVVFVVSDSLSDTERGTKGFGSSGL